MVVTVMVVFVTWRDRGGFAVQVVAAAGSEQVTLTLEEKAPAGADAYGVGGWTSRVDSRTCWSHGRHGEVWRPGKGERDIRISSKSNWIGIGGTESAQHNVVRGTSGDRDILKIGLNDDARIDASHYKHRGPS